MVNDEPYFSLRVLDAVYLHRYISSKIWFGESLVLSWILHENMKNQAIYNSQIYLRPVIITQISYMNELEQKISHLKVLRKITQIMLTCEVDMCNWGLNLLCFSH